VRVFERTPNGPIFYWQTGDPRGKRTPLHLKQPTAKERRMSAVSWADARQAHLNALQKDPDTPGAHLAAAPASLPDAPKLATIDHVFALYEESETPYHSAGQQQHERRARTMFGRYFGADRALESLTHNELKRFERDRMAGRISALGDRVKPGEEVSVGPRTARRDLEMLRQVARWARGVRANPEDVDSPALVTTVPTDGYKMPTNPNPRRPLATEDRYRALLAVSDHVRTRDRAGVFRRSLLTEILTLVHEPAAAFAPSWHCDTKTCTWGADGTESFGFPVRPISRGERGIARSRLTHVPLLTVSERTETSSAAICSRRRRCQGKRSRGGWRGIAASR
jgi:hypothetical protein